MKCLALLLLLWTATIASARYFGPEPVAVRLGGGRPFAEAGLRIGDECYVKPGFFALAGWTCSIVDGGVEVSTGLNDAKEAFLSGTSERLVPLRAVLSALAIKSVWTDDQRTLQAIGSLRSLSFTSNILSISGSLPFVPVFSRSSDNDAIQIDIEGIELGAFQAPIAKCDATSATSVRISIDTKLIPVSLPNEAKASCEIRLSEFGVNLSESQPIAPTTTVQQPKTFAKAQVGAPVAVTETEALSTYEFPIQGQLASPPTIVRIDPSQVQVVFPGATYTVGDAQPALADIRSIDASESEKGLVLNCSLPRPMGVVISTSKNKVTLSLYKPEVGDGKIAGKVIVVDAGHGGTDTGARSNDGSVNEKDVTLAVAIRVAEKLSRQGAVVVMTRKTDVKIPLKERAEIANRNKADFFISIHINSNKLANSRSGSISFYHGGNVISSVLAECMQKHIGSSTGLPSIGVWSDTKIYSTGFAVLRYSKMPAVLLELGFINHTKDLKRMIQPDFQAKVAESVVGGLGTYLGNGEEEKAK